MVSKKICFYSGLFCVLLAFVSCSGLIGKLENATNFSSYAVKHFQQNLDDDDYTEVSEDAQILKGKNGSLTNATPNEYKGFTPKEITQKKIIADGSTVIEVYYDRNICTVSFDTKGVGELRDVTVRAGSKIARPADLVKNCYTFLGWCVDASGTSAFDFENTAVFEDTTIYASWFTLVGTVAKSAIEFDGKVFDKTEEVYVVPPGAMAVIECGEVHPDLVNYPYKERFLMGIFWNNRKIKLSPYIISKYEVTQELYEEVMKGQINTYSNGRNKIQGRNKPSKNIENNEIKPYHPVENISKYEAILFCNRLSELSGLEPVYIINGITFDSSSKG